MKKTKDGRVSKTRESWIAEWKDYKWIPMTNKAPNDITMFEADKFPDNINVEDLPIPKFNVGDRVKFAFENGYLRGNIIKIDIMYEKSARYIAYEIKEIGHRRIVFDKGNLRMERVRSPKVDQ